MSPKKSEKSTSAFASIAFSPGAQLKLLGYMCLPKVFVKRQRSRGNPDSLDPEDSEDSSAGIVSIVTLVTSSRPYWVGSGRENHFYKLVRRSDISSTLLPEIENWVFVSGSGDGLR